MPRSCWDGGASLAAVPHGKQARDVLQTSTWMKGGGEHGCQPVGRTALTRWLLRGCSPDKRLRESMGQDRVVEFSYQSATEKG